MTRPNRRAVVGTLAGVLAVCAALGAAAQAPEVDPSDPASVASAYLSAARAGDAAAMAEQASGFQALALRDVAANGSASDHFDEALGPVRAEQYAAWTGRLFPPLSDGPGRLEIRFGAAVGDDTVTLALREDDGRWSVRSLRAGGGGPTDQQGPLTALSAYYPVFDALPAAVGDPWARAEEFALAFQYRDLVAVAQRVAPSNAALFEEIARNGAAHPAFEEVYGGWRAAAIDAWEGGPVDRRYAHTGWALYALGPADPTDETVAFLVLVEEDGVWSVGDVDRLDVAAFAALPTERPAEPSPSPPEATAPTPE